MFPPRPYVLDARLFGDCLLVHRKRDERPGVASQHKGLATQSLFVAANADTGNPELRFGAKSWNSGIGPLELIPGPGGQAGQDVYQRVYTQGGGFNDYLAGTFVFHEGHDHFHFQEYACARLGP